MFDLQVDDLMWEIHYYSPKFLRSSCMSGERLSTTAYPLGEFVVVDVEGSFAELVG